jgi:F0F1-type ATP synthase delta subunit
VTSKAAAIRYARALFDVALKEASSLDQIETELAAFVDLFTQHPTLQ